MSVCAWICVSWWNHYIFLCWRDFWPLRKCKLPDSAIHLPPLTFRRGLTNWFDKNLFLFPSRCLSLFPHDLLSFHFLAVAVDYSSCFSVNPLLLSHDEPRGILVLYSNSLLLSDPSFISYFLSSLFAPLLSFCLFFTFPLRTLSTHPHAGSHGTWGSRWFT